MIAQQQPATRREIISANLAHDLVRLYVTARESGQFDFPTGLIDNSLTEQLARALFVANRQGIVLPEPLPPTRLRHFPRPNRELMTMSYLGIEITAPGNAAAILEVLAAHYPAQATRSFLSRKTGIPSYAIKDRIDHLRDILRRDGHLDIPKQQAGDSGWALVKVES